MDYRPICILVFLFVSLQIVEGRICRDERCGTPSCDDNDPCTTDYYSGSGCVHTPLNCTVPSACYSGGCQDGACWQTTVNCFDDDDYTADSCDDATGECIHTPIQCDDSNPCTRDNATNGVCYHEAITCSQGNACTNNTCDPTSLYGCTYTSLAFNCMTGNKCQFEGCDVSKGCYSNPVNCNDEDLCTQDYCDPDVGCYYKPTSCDDGNLCTNDSCNNSTGCVFTPIPCVAVDTCHTAICGNSTGCVQVPLCDDGNSCTQDLCDNVSGCSHTVMNCDDGNPCTIDSCDVTTGCISRLVDFTKGEACTLDLSSAHNVSLNISEATLYIFFPQASAYKASYGIATPILDEYQDPKYTGPGEYLGVTFFINFWHNSTETHFPPKQTTVILEGVDANATLYYYDTELQEWTANCFNGTLEVELCHATQYAPFLPKNEENSIQTTIIVVATVVPSFIALVGVLGFVVYKKKKNTSLANAFPGNEEVELGVVPTLPIIQGVTITIKLGGGNFGEVYRGEWRGTDVALKKLKSSSPKDYEEFAKEGNMLFNLLHPNIVQFMGIYENPTGEKFIVTEFMTNGDLLSVMKNDTEKSISIQAMLDMARQAASGMVYLEDKKIVHRDLALRNLLVTRMANNQFVVKVSDFGLSRAIGEATYYQKDQGVLPIKWVAPESIKFNKFSTKSDVWSFGVCLWELFSRGETPYCTMTNAEAVQQVMEGYRMPKPSGCPDEVYEIMLDCWKLEVENRPGFEEILEKLSDLQEDRGTAETKMNSEYETLRAIEYQLTEDM